MKNEGFDKLTIYFFILLLAIIFIFGFQTNQSEVSVVNAQGSSTKDMPAEVFSISIGTSETASSSSRAQELVATKMNKIKTELELLDITISNTNYFVSPNYNYFNNERELTGYTAHMSFIVESSDLDLAGRVISLASNNDANSIGSLRFDLTDETKASVREELLKEAVSNANLEANIAAKASGMRLSKPTKIDVLNYNYAPFMRNSNMMEASFDSEDAYVEVEGVITQSASVSVSYRLR